MKNMIYTILLASMVTPLISCSDESPVLTQRDWDGTTNYFSPIEEKTFGTYYQPYVGYVGDPMPFYDPVAKDFKIMYLQDFRPNPEITYHPIWAVTTKDLSSYTSMGELIPCGAKAEADAALGTGSVIYNEDDKTYYAFYTGHSATANEVIMLATSTDFKTWTKSKTFYLKGTDYGYDLKSFRDPFVFKGEDGLFHMIVSTLNNGTCILAEFTSSNLQDWTDNGEFLRTYDNRFYECADIFKMGDWWYLIYSDQNVAGRRVKYFKANTYEDLKTVVQNNTPKWPDDHEGNLDSRAFYAGKTASDGTNRYIWGWCPTRAGNDNTAVSEQKEPDWGGALVAQKLVQHEDGSLTLGPVEGITSKYKETSEVKVMAQSEEGVQVNNGEYSLAAGKYVLYNRLNVHNKISFKVTASDNKVKFGFSFCRGTDSERYYSMIVSPESEYSKRKLNFEEEGTDATGFISGADSYFFNTPDDNVYDITILTDNSVCVVYINDELAYTNRVYGLQKNCWSINCYDGDITVSDIKVMYY